MGDLDLAATGKDTSIVVTYDGATIRTYEHVRFEAEPVLDVLRGKSLGTTETQIDTIPTGWRITLEIETSKKDVDELIDTILSASILRVPGILSVTEKTTYRNLESQSYIYTGLKLTGSPKTVARGEKTKHRLQLETGTNRIAV